MCSVITSCLMQLQHPQHRWQFRYANWMPEHLVKKCTYRGDFLFHYVVTVRGFNTAIKRRLSLGHRLQRGLVYAECNYVLFVLLLSRGWRLGWPNNSFVIFSFRELSRHWHDFTLRLWRGAGGGEGACDAASCGSCVHRRAESSLTLFCGFQEMSCYSRSFHL